MPTLAAVIAALVSVSVGAVLTYLAQSRQAAAAHKRQLELNTQNQRFQQEQAEKAHQRQFELASAADARALRDKKRERVHHAYADVLLAALTAREVAQEMKFVWNGESKEARDERLNRSLTQALTDIAKTEVRLRLEPTARAAVPIFQKAISAFHGYTTAFRLNEQHPGTSNLIESMDRHLEDLTTHCTTLEKMMQEHLDALEEPL